MKAFTYRHIVKAVLLVLILPAASANAQLGDMLKQGEHGAASSGSNDLGSAASGLTGHAISSGSTGNVAGVLEFCVKNNFLGKGEASSVKDKLMGKLGGESSSSNEDYKDGALGLLKSPDGKQVDLRSGDMKTQVTKQVCNSVLSQGKSLL